MTSLPRPCCACAALQDLPASLTAEQAQSAACQPLVADMCRLLRRLLDLSHLEDAGEQQDAALAWLAANFLAQAHPVVAAMRLQVGRGWVGVGGRLAALWCPLARAPPGETVGATLLVCSGPNAATV